MDLGLEQSIVSKRLAVGMERDRRGAVVDRGARHPREKNPGATCDRSVEQVTRSQHVAPRRLRLDHHQVEQPIVEPGLGRDARAVAVLRAVGQDYHERAATRSAHARRW